MSTPELLFENNAPMTGHNTTWHLEFEGRPIDVKLERGDQPVSITALDTGRDFKLDSKRGQAILALVLDAYRARLITAETALHGLHRRRFYSNGTPTTGTYQEAGAEPQDDGTHRIVMHDVTFDRYPDGQQTHPLFRDVARGRA